MNDTWPPREIYSLEKNLNTLADAVREPGTARTDDEQVWLTRFLLVRSVGYLEQVVHECFRGHITQKSGGTVRSLSLSWFQRSKNPSVDNLCDLLGRLDLNLRVEFEEFLDEEDSRVRRELSLLLDRRHKIAHGLNEGMTPRRALDLVKLVHDVAAWFILRLDPTSGVRRKT